MKSPVQPDPDARLIERARGAARGDTRAFETLVGRHQERVLTNCRYMSGSPDDAQDLAQEVFVKAFFALRRFEGRSTFGTWIQRIKGNHCLNFLRKRKDRIQVDVADPALEAEPELSAEPKAVADLEAEHRRRRIAETLDALPEKLRLALIMRDLDEMSYQEIADVLGIGLSATKMRIKRAREEFRRLHDRKEA